MRSALDGFASSKATMHSRQSSRASVRHVRCFRKSRRPRRTPPAKLQRLAASFVAAPVFERCELGVVHPAHLDNHHCHPRPGGVRADIPRGVKVHAPVSVPAFCSFKNRTNESATRPLPTCTVPDRHKRERSAIVASEFPSDGNCLALDRNLSLSIATRSRAASGPLSKDLGARSELF